MKIHNQVYAVSNYATEELQNVLDEYASLGYELASTEMAHNKYGVNVIYLFFVARENE